MIYGIVFENAADGGVGAFLPDMPGVAAVATDRATAMEMLDKAVQMHVAGMIEDGAPIPDASDLQQRFDAYVILDRTYTDHVPDGLQPYFASSSTVAAVPVVTQGFLGGTRRDRVAAIA